MLAVEVTRHKDREPTAIASGKVRFDQGSAECDIDRYILGWFASEL
jgi:hypothetical protein